MSEDNVELEGEPGETPVPDKPGTFEPGKPPTEDAPKRKRGRPPGSGRPRRSKSPAREPGASSEDRAKAKRDREEKELASWLRENQGQLVGLECWFTGINEGALKRNAEGVLGLEIRDASGEVHQFVNFELPPTTIKLTAATLTSFAETAVGGKVASWVGPLAPYVGIIALAYLLNQHVSGMIALRGLKQAVDARSRAVDATPPNGPGTAAAQAQPAPRPDMPPPPAQPNV
jgi:hypothetical protein